MDRTDGKSRVALLLVVASLLILPFVALRCGGDATSAAPAVNRLERMLAAERTLSYEAMKLMVHGEGERARRRHLFVDHDGPAASWVESVGVSAGRSRRWLQRGSRFYWLANRELLLRNYRVFETGRESVCEREGVGLVLRSVHEGRPSMRMVVDEATGLLLSVDFLDYRGLRTFHSSFTTLIVEGEAIAEEPTDEQRASRSWREGGDRKGSVERAEISFQPLEPKYLPAGFERKGEYTRKQWRPGLHIVYSDGMTWITLRQTVATEGAEEMVVRQSQCGSRTTLRLVYQGISVSLEGSLDPEELLRVLRSVGARSEEGSS